MQILKLLKINFGCKNCNFFLFQHGKKDVVRALLHEGTDPGQLNDSQDTAVDLISSPELKQVFADVLMQATAHGK